MLGGVCRASSLPQGAERPVLPSIVPGEINWWGHEMAAFLRISVDSFRRM
jgi:hypothetical protein